VPFIDDYPSIFPECTTRVFFCWKRVLSLSGARLAGFLLCCGRLSPNLLNEAWLMFDHFFAQSTENRSPFFPLRVMRNFFLWRLRRCCVAIGWYCCVDLFLSFFFLFFFLVLWNRSAVLRPLAARAIFAYAAQRGAPSPRVFSGVGLKSLRPIRRAVLQKLPW